MKVIAVVVVIVVIVVVVVVPRPMSPLAAGAMVVQLFKFDTGFKSQPRGEIKAEIAMDMTLEPINFIAMILGGVDLVQMNPSVEMANQKGEIRPLVDVDTMTVRHAATGADIGERHANAKDENQPAKPPKQ